MKIDELSKAFAIATKCSETPDISPRERNYFRAIARLIWDSCGGDHRAQSIMAIKTDMEKGTLQ